jgi:hypothetical protein
MLRRLLAIALLSLALPACSDSAGPPTTIAGTYVLRQVDGFGMPYQYYNGTALDAFYTGGTMVFRPDKTFIEHLASVIYEKDGTFYDADALQWTGTYTRTGNNIRLVYTSDGTVVDGELEGVFFILHGSKDWTYEKQ